MGLENFSRLMSTTIWWPAEEVASSDSLGLKEVLKSHLNPFPCLSQNHWRNMRCYQIFNISRKQILGHKNNNNSKNSSMSSNLRCQLSLFSRYVKSMSLKIRCMTQLISGCQHIYQQHVTETHICTLRKKSSKPSSFLKRF